MVLVETIQKALGLLNPITIKKNIRLFIKVVSFKVLTGLHCLMYKFEFNVEIISVAAIFFLYRKQLSFTFGSVMKVAV